MQVVQKLAIIADLQTARAVPDETEEGVRDREGSATAGEMVILSMGYLYYNGISMGIYNLYIMEIYNHGINGNIYKIYGNINGNIYNL